ncbi:DUF6440 family protein [Oceanirhabdus sp. W0125-5]|uniref:DUF6440 family protein n=1 Tax=Oceanirhabdus sp. W0125-5 TaxID=2999116 RepID=UPI0022F311F5|nr:DUF6440 family protein [Oceanirhabdus sp. W0125-5]WBW97786.1 DUF6440 family protein [Oceanirhabdus sp. W0125-5]
MKENKRFEALYTQGTSLEYFKVIVDKETGVNYLYSRDGASGGLTVLLDSEGKPIITKNK